MLLIIVLLLLVALAAGALFGSRQSQYFLAAIVGLAVCGWVALWAYDRYNAPHRVADWLNLKEAPRSLAVLDCKDAMLPTDFVSNCLVSIDSDQFSQLLAGYSYEHQSWHSNEVSLATGARKFDATDVYTVTPASFEHGGAVSIYANASRGLAIVDIYIE